jgi:hypothetical protein
MMKHSIARILLLLTALSLAVPESYAKRMGGGRSVGRQAPITRQRAAPPLPPRQQSLPAQSNSVPPPRSQPDLARQSLPPARPERSQWGSMLGGALVGLGLGSLLSSGNSNANPANQNPANPDAASQSSGASGDGSTVSSGAGETAVAPAAEQPQESRLGSVILLGGVALAVILLIRRLRARANQRRF